MNVWVGGVIALQCKAEHEAACRAQAVGATFFGVATAAFWLVMVVVSCACVYSSNPAATLDTFRSYQWWSFIVLVFPLLSIIGTAASDSFVAGQILPLCGTSKPETTLRWTVSVLLFLLAIGTTLWLATFSRVMYINCQSSSSATRKVRIIREQAAMIAYELVALVTVGGYSLTFLSLYYTHLRSFPTDVERYLLGEANDEPHIPYGAVLLIIICASVAAPSWAIIFVMRRQHLDLIRRVSRRLSTGISSSATETAPSSRASAEATPSASRTSVQGEESRF